MGRGAAHHVHACGKYQFKNLEQGNYVVIFQYDTEKYRVTEYKKAGVNNSSNSEHLKQNAVISSKTKWLKGRNFYDGSTQKTVNKWVKSLND